MTESRRGAVAGATPIADGVLANVVSPGFFSTFRIPLVKGRLLTPQDGPSAQKVAVINERLARVGFGDTEPIGRTFHFRAEPDQPFAIVGVVRDVRHNPRAEASPTVYTRLGQGGEIEDGMTLAVQSPRGVTAVADLVRSEVSSQASTRVIDRPQTLDEQIGGLLVREKALALLSGWFGLLALALACIGLYGVLSFDLARRRREIGIRLAIGADPARVLRGVLGESAILTLAGIAIGVSASLAATRFLTDLLYGISPNDPPTIVVAAAVLAVTTLLAGYLPARRAARIDPAVVLHAE
jgi:hypothetical protein